MQQMSDETLERIVTLESKSLDHWLTVYAEGSCHGATALEVLLSRVIGQSKAARDASILDTTL